MTDKGPLIVHNCVQATSRDLLANAMLAIEDAGYDTVMHVHDEAVPEVPVDDANALATIEKIMSEKPAWATGLPLEGDCFETMFYMKKD